MLLLRLLLFHQLLSSLDHGTQQPFQLIESSYQFGVYDDHVGHSGQHVQYLIHASVECR